MDQVMQQLINGLSVGSIYALIALGYTMVYGIIQLINFAHGDIYMVGAYIGFFCMTFLNLGFFESLVVAMSICAILGVTVERIAYRPLRNSPRITMLITAIGVSLVLKYTVMAIATASDRTYPEQPRFISGSFTISFASGDVLIKNQQLLIIGVSIVLLLGLQFIVKRTRIGRAMRAVSQDLEAARLMGVNVDTTISFTFALGSALAGAAGVLVGVYYNSINPMMGDIMGLKAFVAAVFGGIGLIPGAALGGYLIGLLETLVTNWGWSRVRDAVVFAVLIIILIIKPAGLLGKNVKEKV